METKKRCTRCNTNHSEKTMRCPKCSRVLVDIFVSTDGKIIQLQMVSAVVVKEIVQELVKDINALRLEVASLQAETIESNEEE